MKIHSEEFENPTKISEFIKKMENIQNQIEAKYGEFFKEYESEKNIDITNLSGEVNKNLNLHSKYLDRYLSSVKTSKKCKQQFSKTVGELYDYYRFNWDKSTKLSESAISRYVEAHPCFNAVDTLQNTAGALVKYLDETVKMINSRGFYIKYSIEVRKIELGMMG